MTLYWNDSPVLRHALLFLVTSRSQIRSGWDAALGKIKTLKEGSMAHPASSAIC